MSTTGEIPLKFSEWTSYLEKLEEMRSALYTWYTADDAQETLKEEATAFHACIEEGGATCGTACYKNCANTYLKHQLNLPICGFRPGEDGQIGYGSGYMNIYPTEIYPENSLDQIIQACYGKDENGQFYVEGFDAYKKIIKTGLTDVPVGFYQEYNSDGSVGQVYVGVDPGTNKNDLRKLVRGVDNYVILIDKPDTKGCCLMVGVDTTEEFTFDLGSNYVAQGNFNWFKSYVWYKATSVEYPLFRGDERIDLLGTLPPGAGYDSASEDATIRKPMDLVAPIFSISPSFGAEVTRLTKDDAKSCQKDAIIIKEKTIVAGKYTLRGVASRIGNDWIATIPPDMKLWLWAWKLIKLLYGTLLPCYTFEQNGGVNSITTTECPPTRCVPQTEVVNRTTASVIYRNDEFQPTDGPGGRPPGGWTYCRGTRILCENEFFDSYHCATRDESTLDCTLVHEPAPQDVCSAQEDWICPEDDCRCDIIVSSARTYNCPIRNPGSCSVTTSVWLPNYKNGILSEDDVCASLTNLDITTNEIYNGNSTYSDIKSFDTIPVECGGACGSGSYQSPVWGDSVNTVKASMHRIITTSVSVKSFFSIFQTDYSAIEGHDFDEMWAKHICIGSAIKLIKQATLIWGCIKNEFSTRPTLIDAKERADLRILNSCSSVPMYDDASQTQKSAAFLYKYDWENKQVTDCSGNLFSEITTCDDKPQILNVYDPLHENIILKFNIQE